MNALPVVQHSVRQIKKCRAIVKFGPVTPGCGMRAGEFYQVTLDPAMVSPGGEFIRLGASSGDEIHGWQRIDGLTICEILGEYREDGTYPESDGKPERLEMRVAE